MRRKQETFEQWQARLAEWQDSPQYAMLMSWYTIDSEGDLLDEVIRVYQEYKDELGIEANLPMPKNTSHESTIPRILAMLESIGFNTSGYIGEGFYTNDSKQTPILVDLPHRSESRLIGVMSGVLNPYIWQSSAYTELKALLIIMGQAIEELVWRKRVGKL